MRGEFFQRSDGESLMRLVTQFINEHGLKKENYKTSYAVECTSGGGYKHNCYMEIYVD